LVNPLGGWRNPLFNSSVLEVAIGLIFCYASVALIASSIFEAIASWLNLRSKTLLAGVSSLLNAQSPAGEALVLKIYNHALAHPTGNGAAESIKDLQNNPSYIDPKHFALALIESIQSVPDGFATLKADLSDITDPQIRQLLCGMYDRAAGNVQALQSEIAAWFDAGMDRVSGSYKRKSQTWCFVIAFVLAACFNIDSIHLFSTLWQHPTLVAQITAPTATVNTQDALGGLMSLPIGWQTGFGQFTIIGWLITATAALFGAPFWFDLLQQFIHLRGTGPKPEAATTLSPATAAPPPVPAPTSPSIVAERNAIVDLHAALNKSDESYRPIGPGERW
jgi:hypothetical protein